MITYLEKHYQEQIKEFWKEVSIYCKEKEIEDNLYNYINCNKKNYCNENFSKILSAPKILLVCSKAFAKFYTSLDKDFQDDLMEPELYMTLLKDIKTMPILKQQIQMLLKDDFIGK